jgi:anti-anti-sigma regulatory factor
VEWQIFAFTGRVDCFNQGHTQNKLRKLLNEGHNFIAIDLGQAQFVNLPMIQFLVLFAHEVKDAGGQIALLRPTEKLIKHFKVYGTLEAFLVVKNFEIFQKLTPEMALVQKAFEENQACDVQLGLDEKENSLS